jgi:uncharacterized membrane protein
LSGRLTVPFVDTDTHPLKEADLVARAPYRHPVNKALVDDAPRSARIADLVTGFMGSWRFIIAQTVIVAIWLAANIYLLSRPFDPYPFILLNLAFSTQAAYAAPLILLAGNRAAAHDRATLEHAASQADLEEKQNEKLIAGGQESLKHLTEVAERTLAIEEALKAQDDQLLRMEKAILAFERDRSMHRSAGKRRAPIPAVKVAEDKPTS